MSPRIALPKKERDIYADANFDSLNGVKKQKPEAFIPDIKIECMTEFGTWMEGIQNLDNSSLGPSLSERVQVPAEAIVSEALQPYCCLSVVRNKEASALQKGYLIWNGEVWLVVLNPCFLSHLA